jgi:hypothetical protein
MLNDMIASFVASNQIGEEMKKQNATKPARRKPKDPPADMA